VLGNLQLLDMVTDPVEVGASYRGSHLVGGLDLMISTMRDAHVRCTQTPEDVEVKREMH
jgi:hypothetical protein